MRADATPAGTAGRRARAATSSTVLISFDIDGTLEVGEPAGPVPIAFVRWAQGQGCLVGSCSDRTRREQSDMWAAAGIVADFVSGKPQLVQIRQAYSCQRYIHIGDTEVDAHFAGMAGFEFLSVDDVATPQEVTPAWIGFE